MKTVDAELCNFDESIGLQGVRYIFDRHNGPRVLITGSIHGDEPTSMAALWYLAQQLSTLSFNGMVTLIPCVNQLAANAGSRLIPHEETDLNRVFPGRNDGCLAERIAAALTNLLADYDVLIDVHTAGWAIPYVLIDNIAGKELEARLIGWARHSSFPVIREMPTRENVLQGLNRSWSAWALLQGKPAITVEICGSKAINSKMARQGAQALIGLLMSLPELEMKITALPELPFRLEVYSNVGGFFETFCEPGDQVMEGDKIGVVRNICGDIKEGVVAIKGGIVLDIQPVSAINPRAWLATLAVSE
jgi:predicted deacylase